MNYDVFLVDASNLAYRQWWGVRHAKYNGVHTGLEYGFIKKVVSWLNKGQKVCLAWDGEPVRCNDLNENYKSGRAKVNGDEPAWGPRLEKMRIAFADICQTLYHPHEEADEQIAKFAIHNPDISMLIISNDKDLQQLVTDRVHVQANSDLLDKDTILKKWGIPATKIPLWKSLDGDKSDNIPNVPRLATKTKLRLVQDSESLEQLCENFTADYLTDKEKVKLAEFKERVQNNYRLVNLLDANNEYNLTEPIQDRLRLRNLMVECGIKSVSF